MPLSTRAEAETRNLVIAIANKSLYKTKNAQFRELMEKLWMHSLACANCAVRISKTLSLGCSENYFFMGITHDIGKVVLNKAISDAMHPDQKIKLKDVRDTIRDIHAGFGGSLMRRWKYPEKFKKVVTQTESDEYTEHVLQEVLIANLDNHLANKMGSSIFAGEELDELMELDSVQRLGLDAETIDAYLATN